MPSDRMFMEICDVLSSYSKCLSRQLGAILVRGDRIVSTGYNGPPRGIPHCVGPGCPRQRMGYRSGEGLEHCPAAHAEVNAISNAASLGVSTLGTTLYLNTIIPCKSCFGQLLNAGISEIVVRKLDYYDDLTKFLHMHSSVRVREAQLT
jgi:dCMP deaminase